MTPNLVAYNNISFSFRSRGQKSHWAKIKGSIGRVVLVLEALGERLFPSFPASRGFRWLLPYSVCKVTIFFFF